MTAERHSWAGQSTRAQRQEARNNIILEDAGITENTLERYYTAVSRMAPILESVTSEMGLDDAISEWIQEEFEDGAPLYLIGDALSGIHHFEPYTRRKLCKSGNLKYVAELLLYLRTLFWGSLVGFWPKTS